MKVESIAECSFGAFCNTFDLHLAIIGLENQFLGLLIEWPLKTGFTVLSLSSAAPLGGTCTLVHMEVIDLFHLSPKIKLCSYVLCSQYYLSYPVPLNI